MSRLFRPDEVANNIARQKAGSEELAGMMWVCRAYVHENPCDTRTRKYWQTMFSCDFMKPVVVSVSDMRRFNRGLKVKTEAFVLLVSEDQEKFTEGY